MQKLFVIKVMLLTIFWSCSDNRGSQDISSEISEIKRLSAARAKAFNEGNANVIADAFAENGILMPPDMRSMKGREAVRAYYQGIFDQYRTFLESGYDEVKVSVDIAYGVGYAKVKLVSHSGGDTLVSTAKYINILQRQDDGSWLTTYDIWNANGQ